MRNVFSVDVEDYFHPEEMQKTTPRSGWEAMPRRVEASTRRVLKLMEEEGARGTFFVLGWVAERMPELVREIAEAGHEVGCHSHLHRLVYSLSRAEFKEDTERAAEAIERACGVRPRSYRAPSYSVRKDSLWALEVLRELGFTHDSSVYPIEHDRYGIPGWPRHAKVVETAAGGILEVPPASVQLSATRVAAVGGGGYLRLLPYRYTGAGLRRINIEEGQPACVYIHPWEVDPGLPRLAQGRIARWRTYWGLEGMEKKVRRLLQEFEWGPLSEVYPAAGQ